MGGKRRLSIEEKLETHKREQRAHPNAMIIVRDITDVYGNAIVIRRQSGSHNDANRT